MSKGKVYNASMLLNSRGETVAKYRKINLFNAKIANARIKEADNFSSGRKTVTANVKNFKVGMSICYDLRFPGMYRKYCAQKTEILCAPSAFTKKTGEAHWEILLRARAIENLCYVIASNQIGKDFRGVLSYGNSMIVDPWGKVIARASMDREQIIYANVKKDIVKKARQILPGI